MTNREQIEEMIHRFIIEVGMKKEQVYSPEKKAWYWNRGSAKIEVYLQDVKFEEDYKRIYLRIFSPIIKVPNTGKEEFYRTLLEMNDTKLGVKLTVMPGTNQVYATYERDTNGMSYNELVTCIADLEWWADALDDELIKKFGNN